MIIKNVSIKYRREESLYELFDDETNVSYWINKKLKLVRVTRRNEKGMHPYMPEKKRSKGSRKVLNADKNMKECRQSQCEFFKNKKCQPCEECGSESKMINIGCDTCFKCENKPNSLRWNKDDIDINNKEMANAYEQLEEEFQLKKELLNIVNKLQKFQNNKEKENENKKDDENKEFHHLSYVG